MASYDESYMRGFEDCVNIRPFCTFGYNFTAYMKGWQHGLDSMPA